MNTQRIKELLGSLLAKENEWERAHGIEETVLVPATEEMIAKFRETAAKEGVPEDVTEQLVEYYRVSRGEEYQSEEGYLMHDCEDPILYEWWEDGRLWLGLCGDTVYVWEDGKFWMGYGNSFGEEYEFPTLVGLLEKIVGEILENRQAEEEE